MGVAGTVGLGLAFSGGSTLRAVGIVPDLGFSFGVSDRLALRLRGGVGTGSWLEPPSVSDLPILGDIEAGAKVRVGRSGALGWGMELSRSGR